MRSTVPITPAFPIRLERRRAKVEAGETQAGISGDLRLFSMTFAAGFLFFSLFIA